MEASTPRLAPDLQVVQAYRPGGFTVSAVSFSGSVMVFPDHALPWGPATPAAIDLASLDPLRTATPLPDLLVVGMGPGFVPFPAELRLAVRDWGIVVEAMATPAACRTYNLLIAEGRRVAAALLAMPAA